MQRITDLPHEILQDIFLIVASYSGPRQTEIYQWQSFTPSNSAPHSPSYRSSASPYSITHVCRQWRSIALNYPHLWTHLWIFRPANDAIIHILREWIDRGRSMPLHLSLFQQLSGKWSTVKQILCLFLRSIHRCVSLGMYIMPTVDESFDFLSALDVQNPTILETVNVFLYRNLSIGENPLANLTLCSPKIRSIMWSQPNQFDFEDWVLQCWGDLRLLELGGSHEGETILHILSHCHNLEVFTATSPIGDPMDAQGLSPVTLPRLTKLSVPAIPQACSKIFEWLTVPSLVELEIDVLCKAEWDIVADMLERSRANLRVLNVSGDGFEEDAFLLMLERPCFVELKELRMADSGFQNTLRFLAYSGYLRRLEKVVLERIDFDKDDEESDDEGDDEDLAVVFSTLVEEMAKSLLGTWNSEKVHQYLDFNFQRVSLTIPPVPVEQ